MTRQRRIGLVHAALALFALAVLAKSMQVQLVQGRAWSDLARRQHFTATRLPAPRGLILDASGRTLATTREVVRLEVAPREVREIAERTLADAVARLGAEGGDIVILDPRNGEVLAMAGERRGVSASVTSVTEPFEPGSTLKPLIASALLSQGKARVSDHVPG